MGAHVQIVVLGWNTNVARHAQRSAPASGEVWNRSAEHEPLQPFEASPVRPGSPMYHGRMESEFQ